MSVPKEGQLLEMEPSAQTLHDFLNIVPAVLYEYLQHQDGSGEIRYVSPTARGILGYPGEYFVEDTNRFWELIHPDDRMRFRAEDEASVNDSFFAREVRIVWPSGDVRWVRFLSKPSRKTEEGSVVWIGCVVDVTVQKHAEEEVQALRGIIPICMHCKKIRDDKGYWNRLEKFISEHSGAQFSHSICDKCLKEHYRDIV